jgi:hypothetical protein
LLKDGVTVLPSTAASSSWTWEASEVQEELVSGARSAPVFSVQQNGRTVYCGSPACVQALLGMGWQLSDSRQLTALVKELAAGSFRETHDPADHFR